MLAALVAGERDPKVLAQLARQRLRAKLGLLEEAFCGHFSDHHAFLLATMLERIDRTSADIAAVEAKLEAEIAPFQAAVDRLDESPASAAPPRGSSSPRSAPTWAASPWASGLLGSVRARRQGIGRQDQGQGHHRPRQPLPGQGPGGGRRGRGQDQHLPGRALPAHRPAPRRQAGRGAVGRSILIIIWHLRSDPTVRFHDLGPGSTTPASTPTASGAITSASWRRWATRSPCNPPPDPHPAYRLDPAPLCCAGCCRLPGHR